MDLLSADDYYDNIRRINLENNQWSAGQAQKQMDYQTMMSNTAHQREMADLKAAGLNPILAANNGAAVTVGAMGDTDESGASALINALGNMLSAMVSMENQRVAAQTQIAVAERNNAMSKVIAELNNAAAMSRTRFSARQERYMAEIYPKSYPQMLSSYIKQLRDDLGIDVSKSTIADLMRTNNISIGDIAFGQWGYAYRLVKSLLFGNHKF